ncbi:hypothetical protein [Staphylococcus equorum]|uniref:hypothetical protein n=1 Tax=Staphylococcus equorum TaxID=246432 RepID=UPI00192D0064|nr:hypothetical protein [Staphylococcus equorum]
MSLEIAYDPTSPYEKRFGEPEVLDRDYFNEEIIAGDSVYYDEDNDVYISDTNLRDYLQEINIRKVVF